MTLVGDEEGGDESSSIGRTCLALAVAVAVRASGPRIGWGSYVKVEQAQAVFWSGGAGPDKSFGLSSTPSAFAAAAAGGGDGESLKRWDDFSPAGFMPRTM
jgi:hypothetical protein